MRYLMRSNATHGSAGFANIEGYYVGGKTGTAQKIVNRHYSNDKVFTTFMAIVPADKPKYLYHGDLRSARRRRPATAAITPPPTTPAASPAR